MNGGSSGWPSSKNGGNSFGNGAHALSSISTNKKLFGKFVDGSSKKDRLEELLERTEQYTRFILQQNVNHHHEQQKKAGKSTANLKDGKASITKRRIAKGRKLSEDEEGDSSDSEN